ncbi:HEAT repeat domain-containing protein [Aggregatilinea lenta]|uniref:HEAT repeat domain-containing protein n=1 Tax=Aggregatilinea lenta TaxID=913108 RepID=UPI000E5B9E71|nr:HEAT repeat domain-containing protein [Aggregatilinea lenta]
MGEVQPSVNVLESLQLLRSDNPIERKHGIVALSGIIEDPRVLRVFEHLYENDPDSGVRQMAWRAINRQGPSIPAPGPVAAPAQADDRPPAPAKASAPRSTAQPEPFLINPANVRLLAAQARSQSPWRGGWAFFLAAVVLLAAGLAWGWVLPGWIDQIQLNRDGVTAAGEVIRLYEQSSDGGSPHYYASYRFTVGEDTERPIVMRTEQRITEHDFARLDSGSPIEVTYVSGAPERVRLSIDTPAAQQRETVTVAAAGLSVAAILLLIIGLLQHGRAPRMRGRILWGEVVRAVGELDARGRYTVRMRYRFRLPNSKKWVVKQTGRPRSDLDPEDIPQPGTPVVVYYRTKKEHRLL